MGTINYKTSDYITMGVKPYDFTDDKELMQLLQDEVNEYGGTIEEELENYINGNYEEDYANIERELNKYDFYYYSIKIEPGYYEGFALDIESNFPVAFDYFAQRREAQKEITQLKKLLTDCAGLGLVSCRPGWCTSYEDYNGTLAEITKAIKEMRQDVNATPTWRQYERGAA